MAASARVPGAKLTGISGNFLKWYAKRSFGAVPEAVEVMWHQPKLLQFGLAVEKARKWKACDKDLKSYAHIAVAALIGCEFCLDMSYFKAYNDGLDVAKAREVPRWRESTVFTPLERDVLEFAEAMSQTPPAVSDDLFAKLLKQLGAAEPDSVTAGGGRAGHLDPASVASP